MLLLRLRKRRLTSLNAEACKSLLGEQRLGFALKATDMDYVRAAGRVSSGGEGGAHSTERVREAVLI